MIKRNLWKIITSLLIVGACLFWLFPLKDHEFIDFVKIEALPKKQAEFNTLLDEAISRSKPKSDEFKTTFVALRKIAKDRNINLNDFFGFDVSRGSIENINNDVLDHLLKRSKAKLRLGLDLKGGVAFTLEIAPQVLGDLDEYARKQKLEKAIEIITSRINAHGVTEPVIRPVSDIRLEVQLPDVNTKDNPDVIDALQKPALLEFRLVHPYLSPHNSPEIPAGYERMVLEDIREGKSAGEELYIKRRFEADGKIMSQAYVHRDTLGQLEIIMRFTSDGRKQFARITKGIVDETASLSAQLGRPLPAGRLAIILDGKLYSAPTVQKEIDSDTAQITGRFSEREAVGIAKALNNPLDVPLVVKEQYIIGPSLAEDAVKAGKLATYVSIGLIVAFMVFFYSSGGLLAVFMLAINAVIIFGVMAQFGATLTLPGLAGIVLTMGMAIDANILIFERMREEIADGKSLSVANQAGFRKALWTILDAHFVQLLICGVMIIYGTGPIKGFGVTLAIGVCSTLFSVLITGHMIMELLIDGGWLKKITMRHLLRHAPRWDFVKWGWKAFLASWSVVVIGIVVIAITGKAIYGIDFAGGDAVTFKYDAAHKTDTGAIRTVATAAGVGEIHATYVKPIGGENEVLRIETPHGKAGALVSALQEKFPEARFESIEESSVGASIGNEILWKAIIAIVIAMIVTLLYIAFRFEFGFGIGAMFSSMHDILMVVGLFVVIGHTFIQFQFSAPMVAAILAIAGYSINETVVVFDRIREELRINQGGTLRDIVNTAINKVFARTIMTASSTFMVAVALFVFGTGVLQEIAFTFAVGIVAATFSAIFISSQVFYYWHKGDRKRVEKHQDVKPTYEWTGASKASE